MAPLKKSFMSTEYCALCRGRFPSNRLEGLGAWQSEFRAALCLDADEQSLEITEAANLPDIEHDVDVDISLAEPPRIETITICRSSSSVNAESPYYGPAFCFHDWCYSVLIWKLGCHPPQSIIYKLVRTIIPKSSTWQNICEAGYQLDPAGTLQTLIAHADRPPYKPQLLLMSRLPVEVRVRIWEYVGLGTPYSAFILVAGETSRLARYVESRQTHNLALKRGCHLLAKTIMVFGTEYIQHLGYDTDLEATSSVLGDVTGLRFIASIGGICAIKLTGVDWETNWLGKVPEIGNFWYGMTRNPIPYVCCIFNHLNISSLDSCSSDLVLWDQPNIPSSLADPDVISFSSSQDITDPSRSGAGTRKSRFFRYLPLYKNGEYITSLTIYQNGRGIVGLEAHFSHISQLSGCRSGCSLHFPLSPKEKIAYCWLRVVNYDPAFYGLALAIQTTFGRFHTFGSYIVPQLVTGNQYKWILLKNSGCIIGLYYENPSFGTTIIGLGVIDDGTSRIAPPLTPQYHARVFPPFPGPNGGTFLSVASLSGFEKVDLCRVENRCIGILIHYINGLSEVLGQWRVQSVARHSCIYSSDIKNTTHIYFTITRFGDHKIVTNIRLLNDMSEAEPDSEYHILELGQRIVWWFSEFDDAILPWTGDTRNILKENESTKEQFIL